MKCVIYTRVSSKDQEKEGFSIPAQRKLLLEYAHKKHIEVVKEFSQAETAKSAGRIFFGEMVEFIKNHRDIRILLVEKTDRLYRNFRDYVDLEELDLEIHLVKENEIISKDSRSHAKFIHGIKVLMAKNYIDNLSEEVKKGMLEKAGQGIFPGKAPVGYLNDTTLKTIVPDQKYVPFVHRLYSLYATGDYSLQTLRERVTAEGWRTPAGRVYAKSQIEWILKNPIYSGEFVWKGNRYRGHHESLVSVETFAEVQKKLRTGVHVRDGRKDFLFRGLLTCSYCGCALVGELKKGKYVYYHCTQARGKCPQPWIREEKLDGLLSEVFAAITVDDRTVADIVRALRDSQVTERDFRENESKRLQRRYADLQSKLDRAYEDRLEGTIDDRFWRDLNAKWRAEQDQVNAQLERLQGAHRNFVDEAAQILELAKAAYSQYLRQGSGEKRKLLRAVLSNCTFDGATLCPTYKTPFNLIAEGVSLQKKLRWLDSNQRPAD